MQDKKNNKNTKVNCIPENWTEKRLIDVSTLIVSNVDKKIHKDEKIVKLCNYLDVYNNEYIDSRIDFKNGTVNQSEYDKFKLFKDDVIITKDSETPDDIGVPSVVVENIDNLICGYHLAILRPLKEIIYGCYLACAIKSSQCANQFTRFATGLTRYGLTKSSIEEVKIPLPLLPEQKKIADILSTVDEQITNTEAIIKKTQELKKGLMQRLFINKAFMTKTNAKKISTKVSFVKIKQIGQIITGTTPSTKNKKFYSNKDFMFIGPSDLGINKFVSHSEKYISKYGFEVTRKLPKNSIMVVCIGATIGKVGLTTTNCATNQQINSIIPINTYYSDYIYYLISGIKKYLLSFSGDTATPILNKNDFGNIYIYLHPNKLEQKKTANILSTIDNKIEQEQQTKQELEQLKKGLMQQLLTGKKRVKI